jgi:hypothetical protein
LAVLEEIMDEKGLYTKYKITYPDGKPVSGYCFVLKPEKDPAARAAMAAYAEHTDNWRLRRDINDYLAWLEATDA